MTVPVEAIAAIVRLSVLSKEQTFDLVNEWQPDVTDEELEQMWQRRMVN